MTEKEKEPQGTKKRTFCVHNGSMKILVESNMEKDTPKQLLDYTLKLLNETKKCRGGLSYVT